MKNTDKLKVAALAAAIAVVLVIVATFVPNRPTAPDDQASKNQVVKNSPSATSQGTHQEKSKSASPRRPSFNFLTKDPVLVEARKSYSAILNEMEGKNAKPLFERKFGDVEIVAVAISAPTKEDMEVASIGLTSILEKVPPGRRNEAREHLEGLYYQYTWFRGAYRVLYATRRGDEDTISVDVQDFNDLSEAYPSEDGIVSSHLGSHFFTSDDPERGWRSRYGYLLELEKDKENSPDPKSNR